MENEIYWEIAAPCTAAALALPWGRSHRTGGTGMQLLGHLSKTPCVSKGDSVCHDFLLPKASFKIPFPAISIYLSYEKGREV